MIVIDLQGIVRMKLPINDAFATLAVNDLLNGVYIIKAAAADGKIYRGKMMVQR